MFSGNFEDYAITQAGRAFTFVSGADGHDRLHKFEVLQFDDGTFDIATGTFTAFNSAPEAGDVAATVSEPLEQTTTAAFDNQLVPNLGTWYVVDFDSGDITRIPRDTGSNNTVEQVAPQNGAVFSINPNNENFGFAAWSVTDNVATAVDPTTFSVSDYTGTSFISVDDTGVPTGLNLENSATGADVSISFDVAVHGGTARYTFDVSDVDFVDDASVSSGVRGSVRVDTVTATMTFDPDTAPITITPDATDADGDTLVFTLDTTGTLGDVTLNPDGTFTYDTNGAFDDLDFGDTATDTFTYTVDDGNGGTDTATVTVTILGADDFIL